MSYDLREHPDIESAHRTGYGLYNQPESYHCEECGKCLDDEEVYETASCEFLCEACLLAIHKKWW